MSNAMFRPWRRATAFLQAAVILGLPFVTVNGQSALRFDVPSLRLHFFGTSIAIDEFYLLAAAVLFCLFLFISVTILLGRLWCGWACPQTVLSDLTGFLDRPSRTPRVLQYLPVAALSMLVAADIIWYFVPPYEFIHMLRESPVVLWSFIVISVIMFLDLAFIRRVFCSTVCPYAKLQSVLFDDRTLLIAFDPSKEDECMGCGACRNACPVGIDIRDGLDMACISCAECVDACTLMRMKVGKNSLVGYFWGSPARRAGRLLTGPIRLNVALLTLASAVFLTILLHGSFTRADFAATIRLNPEFSPSRQQEAIKVNSYILSIRNHSSAESSYSLRSGTAVITTRDELRVSPGGAGTFIIYAALRAGDGHLVPKMIKIEVVEDGAGEAVMLETPFAAP